MGKWQMFIIAVLTRLVAGFIGGCCLSCVVRYKAVLRSAGENELSMSAIVTWGVVVAIGCVFTTPRSAWPWKK